MKKIFLAFALPCTFLALSVSAQHAGNFKISPVVNLLTDYTAQLTITPDSVYVLMNGPSDRWFAMGFGAQGMVAGTDVVFFAEVNEVLEVYDGHLTGNAPPVADADQNWIVEINESVGSIRTILVKRPLVTGDDDDYTFIYEENSLPVIFAYGAGPVFGLAFHQSNRGADVFAFEEVLSDGTMAQPLEESLQMFPNPTSGMVRLTWDDHIQLSHIRVLNVQAREVFAKSLEAGSRSSVIDLQGLPAGLYYLEALSNKGRALVKLIRE